MHKNQNLDFLRNRLDSESVHQRQQILHEPGTLICFVNPLNGYGSTCEPLERAVIP